MNILQNLSIKAQEDGEKTAYKYKDYVVSYKMLDEQATKFASGLQTLGVQKGDHVALLLNNSYHFIVSLYGVLRAGAVAVPINPLYTKSEIQYILQDSDVKTVISIDSLLNSLEREPYLKNIIVCPTERLAEADSFHVSKRLKGKVHTFTEVLHLLERTLLPVPIDGEDVAMILYTSGTTGKPKGAMLTHTNIYSNARDTSTYLNIAKSDRIIAVLPMFHVFCLTVCINAPLIAGATILILPKFSPSQVFSYVSAEKATIFAGVPTMYNFLCQYENGTREALESLRLCVSGGSSMPGALLGEFEEKFQISIREGYGLSEASPVTCFNPPRSNIQKEGSVGVSIVNVENKVVDGQGEEVPFGEIGELVVKGPNVMKGYYKLEEETRHIIKDGWLYTGDLARMDEDGYIYIVDRKKDLIIVGGYNVYPREVEERLYEHKAVVEAAAIGEKDETYGEVVKAYVVTKKAVSEEEILEFCKTHLAPYKVPRNIVFLDELPKNTTGKILRRALKKKLSEEEATHL
ncbi:long-chain-fatty-acid--CoA ligase [Priestia endophytica]|uniref:long-chain-fatty-acid--CoA ligase n=1 Tax=Priestia endophytica TaxID=135735 RepID=UPI000DCA415D|nr:long-chain-fatty-acid--CoA ligase [Priestia endophytica]RAS73732.1 long-chain fatty acid--CoA ligase [Priestia endophytica]